MGPFECHDRERKLVLLRDAAERLGSLLEIAGAVGHENHVWLQRLRWWLVALEQRAARYT
jgi:hypothetical protein